MKKLRFALLLIFCCLCVCGLSACAEAEPEPGGDVFSDTGVYLGFESMPVYATPQDALSDGCFVVVSQGDDSSQLYGGKEHWNQFLKDSENGVAALLRVVHFVDETPYAADLLFRDGAYYYFDAESTDLHKKPFSCLRKLTGRAGNPEKDSFLYVLTDSTELTYGDVSRVMYSSDSNAGKDLPDYRWLGFTTYLDE